jgi:L-fucose isomerase
VAPGEVDEAKSWLQRHVREVVFDGVQFTPEKWSHQLRCYIALKQLVDDIGFDFIGLKCHYELSEFHSVQCMSAAFLNDPYDWRGPKTPVPLACEADSDGALTMQMLHLLSDLPACLLDLRFFDRAKNVYVMPNCGAAPTWFAARSADPAENLRNVSLVPSICKYAGGGAHLQFVFRSGPITLARLTRSPEGYQMFIALGEAIEHEIDDVAGAGPNWPHAFVRLAADPSVLVQTLQANHLHGVAGDYRSELLTLCRLLDVRPVVLDQSPAPSAAPGEKGTAPL